MRYEGGVANGFDVVAIRIVAAPFAHNLGETKYAVNRLISDAVPPI